MELSFANKESLLAVMGKVFGWQMEHLCPPQTDWKPTTFWAGVMGAYAVSGDPQYLLAARRVGEQNSWHPGPQKRSADDHCIAQTYLEIYMADRDPRMLSPIRETFDGILRRPGDEPLVWKNAIWLREWAWCDALFMAPPAWALIYKATEERKYLDFMFQRWWKTSAFLYDPKECLFFRDSRYFQSREPNGKKVFWGRGNGWVLAGLARVLRFLPADYPDQAKYIRSFREMANRLLGLQASDGFWRSSLLDPESHPGGEASATALLSYALASGINQGLLSEEYHLAVVRGMEALVGCVGGTGRVGFVQPPAGEPAPVGSQSWAAYGAGAFLLAASETLKLIKA